ncbi:hypothetical protein [Thermogemmatispora carboxidivorans]|uniref:hypothetical protein n=1 Tax=Thermogemmatispora carboxidivorans TaxID=1382306 RepID=UPI00069CA5D2|nr:hypothetical protein [Thermogemmatispora carboxidivorans]
MALLIRYKYLSGRRPWGTPLFAWAMSGLVSLLLILSGVAVALVFGRIHHLTAEEVALWLLVVTLLTSDLNAGRVGLLTSRLAREWEYLLGLPLVPWQVALTVLSDWFLSNILALTALLLAPLLALGFSGLLPFTLTPAGCGGLLLYCGFVMLFGTGLHLLSLVRPGAVLILIRFASIGALALLFLAFSPSSLHAGISEEHLRALRSFAFDLVSLWCWPWIWALAGLQGHWLFLLPLTASTALVAAWTLPRLLRYWELAATPERRASFYPLTASGRRWAVAKWLCLALCLSPQLRLPTLLVSRLAGLLALGYFFPTGAAGLWLLGCSLATAQLGWPAYSYLVEQGRLLRATGLPLHVSQQLLGFSAAFTLIYLPFMSLSLLIIGLTGHSLFALVAFLPGYLGLLALAWCAWREVPPLPGFIALGLCELLAALLLAWF